MSGRSEGEGAQALLVVPVLMVVASLLVGLAGVTASVVIAAATARTAADLGALAAVDAPPGAVANLVADNGARLVRVDHRGDGTVLVTASVGPVERTAAARRDGEIPS